MHTFAIWVWCQNPIITKILTKMSNEESRHTPLLFATDESKKHGWLSSVVLRRQASKLDFSLVVSQQKARKTDK